MRRKYLEDDLSPVDFGSGPRRERSGVVVLGMGRSGTSMVTAMFVAAGYYADEADELMIPNEANPKGFYENLRIFDENQAILESLERSWFDAPTDAELATVPAASTASLGNLLGDLFHDAGPRPLAIKDPRIGVLLPLWLPLIDRQLELVLAVRDPLEIALSLERRDGTPLPFALASWEVHMTGLLAQLAGRTVMVAPYHPLIAEPQLASELVGATTARLSGRFAGAVDPRAAGTAVDLSLHPQPRRRARTRAADDHLPGRALAEAARATDRAPDTAGLGQ